DYTGPFVKVEGGKIVPNQERRRFVHPGIDRILRDAEKRRVLSRVRRVRTLPMWLFSSARPRSSRRSRVLRIRVCGSAAASRDGPGEPEPPLSTPGSAGLIGV